ncbi:MAG: hypothetical protein SWQ30_09740 [Thermodesulfobacteriota bacterium]|nr:hypothetical protein [Thermodesulfobacteriota bacterium]
MKSKTVVLCVLMTCVCLVGSVTTGVAQGDPLAKMQSELNLTPSQVEQLEQLGPPDRNGSPEAFRGQLESILSPDQMSQMRQQGMENHEREMQSALNLTSDQIAQMEQLGRPGPNTDPEQFRGQLESILTPDQMSQMDQMHQQRMDQMGSGEFPGGCPDGEFPGDRPEGPPPWAAE